MLTLKYRRKKLKKTLVYRKIADVLRLEKLTLEGSYVIKSHTNAQKALDSQSNNKQKE